MSTITQNLWLARDAEAAVRFYTGLIPGSTMGAVMTMAADSPSGPAGSVKLLSFTLGDQRYAMLEAGGPDRFNHSFSIMVECDDQAEVDRLWEALLDGGAAQACGWLKDRWGLFWQIVPRMLLPLMADPDRAKAKRVAEAMMTMVKLDVSALEAAAAG